MNIYRFAAVPGTLQWWVKAPDYVGWVHVDLARELKAARPHEDVLTASAP